MGDTTYLPSWVWWVEMLLWWVWFAGLAGLVLGGMIRWGRRRDD